MKHLEKNLEILNNYHKPYKIYRKGIFTAGSFLFFLLTFFFMMLSISLKENQFYFFLILLGISSITVFFSFIENNLFFWQANTKLRKIIKQLEKKFNNDINYIIFAYNDLKKYNISITEENMRKQINIISKEKNKEEKNILEEIQKIEVKKNLKNYLSKLKKHKKIDIGNYYSLFALIFIYFICFFIIALMLLFKVDTVENHTVIPYFTVLLIGWISLILYSLKKNDVNLEKVLFSKSYLNFYNDFLFRLKDGHYKDNMMNYIYFLLSKNDALTNENIHKAIKYYKGLEKDFEEEKRKEKEEIKRKEKEEIKRKEKEEKDAFLKRLNDEKI